MKVVAFIINIFLPGVGTLLVGKLMIGVIQIVLAVIAAALAATVIGWIIGGPLYFIVWIWALISVATAQPLPPEERFR